MTLNKEICQMCVDENTTGSHWVDADDARWNKGWVLCPKQLGENSNEEIPDHCLYRVEQIVAAREETV
jgi:hypothetical protein